MWQWLIPLASAGIGAYQTYRRKPERREYKFSPYEQMAIDELMREYRGNLPQWLTAPYHAQARRLRQQTARHPGLAGAVSGIEARDIYGPMAEAGERYKSNLMSMIGSLTRGTGETVYTEPKDYSSALWDLGYALRSMKGLPKAGEEEEEEEGVMPESFKRKFSLFTPGSTLNYPYLWKRRQNARNG